MKTNMKTKNEHNFLKLEIWKRAMDLSVEVFELTKTFPSTEMYSLTNQIRRSSYSVPSNIAEGSCQSTDKSFNRYLLIATGSLAELQTQLILSKRVGYSTDVEIEQIT